MSRVSYQTIRVMLRCFLQFEASPSSGQELRDMGQERFQVKSCPIWMLVACETDRLSSLIKASEILCRGDNSQTIHLYIPGISAYGCIWYTDIYGIWSKMMGIEVSEQAQWIKRYQKHFFWRLQLTTSHFVDLVFEFSLWRKPSNPKSTVQQ